MYNCMDPHACTSSVTMWSYVHLCMYVDTVLLLYTSRYVVVFLVQEAFPGHSDAISCMNGNTIIPMLGWCYMQLSKCGMKRML